jgi:hypothetical protein
MGKGPRNVVHRRNIDCTFSLALQNYLDENDEVLISGFGRRGKAKGDIPGVRFKVVKVSGVGLLALWKEKKVRLSSLLSILFKLWSSPTDAFHRICRSAL